MSREAKKTLLLATWFGAERKDRSFCNLLATFPLEPILCIPAMHVLLPSAGGTLASKDGLQRTRVQRSSAMGLGHMVSCQERQQRAPDKAGAQERAMSLCL